MTTLDEIITAIAKAGKLSHVTLASTTKGFQAAFRDTVSVGYRIEIDADPVAALRKVMDGAATRRGPRLPAAAAEPAKASRKAPERPRDDIDDLI